jgi:uncharacterized 2Fe-2S/4Fe-4S cluster protein (DUF4445 family)
MHVVDGRVSHARAEKLSAKDVAAGYVLGCQAHVQNAVIVDIPGAAHTSAAPAHPDHDRFMDFLPVKGPVPYTLTPVARKICVALDTPSPVDSAADHQRLCAALQNAMPGPPIVANLDVVKQLPALLTKHHYRVTATISLHDGVAEISAIEGGDTSSRNFIVAVDMGTTTVVAHLMDAHRGKTIAAAACFNSQASFGQDVTSRLIRAEKKGCAALQAPLVEDINRLIAHLAGERKISLDDVTAIVCAGNTAMCHFLLALPVSGIRRTPFVATSTQPPPMPAAHAGVRINPRGLLHVVPGVAAWIGGDITAGIFATGLYEQQSLSMLVDIGTNGEIVVGNREWLMACSASAGPALEGASVECGMRAETGAIEKVSVRHSHLAFATIGNAPAVGLCGSGIIDLIAALLSMGTIDRGGKFVRGSAKALAVVDGIPRLMLVDGKESGGRPVFITETDIENVITAKAAIYAAITILLRRLELSVADIKHFYLAGAFGKYINIDSAMAIGLIPALDRQQVEFAGNTSLHGAALAALHQEAYAKIADIARKTICYDLMGAGDYLDEFKKARFLPHTDIEQWKAA